MTEKQQKDGYATVRLPLEFAEEIDRIIGKHGFTSRAEIVKEAVRTLFEKYQSEHMKILNHDDKGVKLWDDDLKLHAEIQIMPKGVYCSLCDASKCPHIRYALSQPDVREYTLKRIKEGWKIEFPEE